MEFEWDEEKARLNASNHSISFEEAAELFRSGTDYLELYDVEHSMEEDRFICIGPIVRGLVVVVVTERGEDVLRIISARFASRRERTLFSEHIGGDSD